MNILMPNHNVRGRSTYLRCLHFARQLVRRGHSVDLLTISPDKKFSFRSEQVDGVIIIESPDLLKGKLRTGWDPWNTLRRVGFLRKRNYDLVHAFDSRPAVVFPALYCKYMKKIPMVMDWADWWGRGGAISERDVGILNTMFAPVETFFEERFRKHADGLTFTSKALVERAVAMGLGRNKMLLVSSGSDVEGIKPIPRRTARHELGLAGDFPMALFAGFVQYDLELVLRSFALALEEEPRAKLMLVGPESPLTSELGRELGISDDIIETGAVPYDDMDQYLSAADVLLLPLRDSITNRGRQPIKTGDYMAAGRAIVANHVGEVGIALEESGFGLAAGETPQEFADAILSLFRDRDMAEALGRRAREMAETRYSWHTMTDKLESFYRQVVESSKGNKADENN
ncbi:glycosyltransferase family 4 protein [Candidatus Hydrogenedentota bacterium]